MLALLRMQLSAMNNTRTLFLTLILIAILPACQTKPAESSQVLSYVKLDYASGFGIANFKNYSQLFVLNGKDTFWGVKNTELNVNNQKTAVLSTVFSGFLEALGLTERIVAVDKISYYCDSALIALYKSGKVSEIGEEGNINLEKLVRLKPSFLIASNYTATDKVIDVKLKSSGTLVLPCDNFKENHPLARAEWIKYFGFAFNCSQRADSIFERIKNNYEALTAQAKKHPSQPLVMTDAMYSGSWNVPGGNSYTARLIQDAGGQYVFSDKTDHYTYPLNLESVMKKAAEADVWIHVNLFKTLDELKKSDTRYSLFRPYREHRVYNYNKRENAEGGNDFWEQGVVRPDLVLKDLIQLLQNKNISTEDLYFYRRLD